MRNLKWWHITGFLAVSIIGIVGFGFYLVNNLRFCTLADCLGDSITVAVTTPLPDRYDVEVWYDEDEYVKFRCENNQLSTADAVDLMSNNEDFGQAFTKFCAQQTMTSQDIVDEFTLKITWIGGSYEETIHPSYNVNQPNGPDCEPTCRTAYVQLNLDTAN